MGLTIHAIDFFLSNKEFFKGRDFLALGSPFIKDSYALFIQKKYPSHDFVDLAAQPSETRGIYLFKKILQVKSLKILDISDYEGADIVANLNLQLPSLIDEKFDVIFDGGTHEHTFNNVQSWKNIIALLNLGGSYVFDLPANNMIDHGFRQYSPTYFYDVCHANQPGLVLNHLSLWSLGRKYGLNALPYYQRLDLCFKDVSAPKFAGQGKSILNLGRLTYSYMQLMAAQPRALAVMGVVSKRCDLSFNSNIVQCIYRISTAKATSKPSMPSSQKGLFTSHFFKRWFSKLIFQGYFPIPLSMYLLRKFSAPGKSK